MKATLVDCTDHKCVYGILTVNNADIGEVQAVLWSIKSNVQQQEDWTLDDIFAQFPAYWKWEFESGDYVLQV